MNILLSLKKTYNIIMTMLGFHAVQMVNAFETTAEVTHVSAVDHLYNSIKLCETIYPFTLLKLDAEIETTIPTMNEYSNYLFECIWVLTSHNTKNNERLINKTCLGRETMALVPLSAFLSHSDRYLDLATSYSSFLDRAKTFITTYKEARITNPDSYNIRMADIIIGDLTDIFNRILYHADVITSE